MGEMESQSRALRLMLTPLVRFCVRNGISAATVIEQLKKVFVAQANAEVESSGERSTVSQVSIISGLPRREIKRLLQDSEVESPYPSLISRLIGQWEQDSRFRTKPGKPRVLSYGGESSEFKVLVESVSKDVHPGTVLQELIRQNLVTRTTQGIKLQNNVHEQHKLPEKVLNLVSRDFETLGNALSENMFVEQEVRNLHMRTEYDNVFVDEIPQLRAWLLENGADLHRRAREYIAKFDKDLNPAVQKRGGGRVVLGAFSWTAVDNQTKR